VLDAARGHRLEALFLLNVTTGMRQGEILGLVWSDIDWDGEFLTARFQLQREPTDRDMPDGRRKIGEWVRKPLKGKRARRIYLPARTAEALRRRQREQRQEDSEHPWGLVFTLPDGRPLNAAHVRLMHHAILADAGVRPQKFHDMRHAAATILLDQGVPMHLVSAMLGHASLSTTDRVYRHIADQTRRRAAEAMDAAFEERPPDGTIRPLRAVPPRGDRGPQTG
jgi:integrase